MKTQKRTYLNQTVGKHLWGEKKSVREGFPKEVAPDLSKYLRKTRISGTEG